MSSRLVAIPRRPPRASQAACLTLLLASVFRICAQDQTTAGPATLSGLVRDARGPVPAAVISLAERGNARILTATTDSQGAFRFAGLQAGTYVVEAVAPGYAEASSGPMTIAAGAARKVELTLAPAKQPPSATSLPAFFDEPAFIVAGVTESTYQGGHGSDTVMRSTEALAKATASLGTGAGVAAPRPSSVPSIPTLEEAFQREPANLEAGQKFAAALVDAGQFTRARSLIPSLISRSNRPELHHLLAVADERGGFPLDAVHEYQLAAELDPSEANLFDWGTELLVHRADEPAIEVFSKGRRLFPASKRIALGLAAAWYARGTYDRAVASFAEATDLNPNDPEPYMFLAKVQSAEITGSDTYLDRLARFAALQPDNPLANFYYGSALARRCLAAHDLTAGACPGIQPLLEKTIRLDSGFAPAYLQLGIFFSGQRDFRRAIDAYGRAIEISPGMEEAHYRLAQAYRLSDQAAKAQEELAIYNDLSRKSADRFARERAEIQQFVYELRAQPAVGPN